VQVVAGMNYHVKVGKPRLQSMKILDAVFMRIALNIHDLFVRGHEGAVGSALGFGSRHRVRSPVVTAA
jgi:hypothetical protein